MKKFKFGNEQKCEMSLTIYAMFWLNEHWLHNRLIISVLDFFQLISYTFN